MPKLGSAKANLGTTSPSPFKKTQSYIANKYVIPTVGSTPMNRTNGNLPIHGLAGDMFKNNTGQVDDANLNSQSNPFKIKRNMQEMLITREKERYMKLAKRHGFESSLQDPSLINISQQDEIAFIKARQARRNNSMKSHTVLELASE